MEKNNHEENVQDTKDKINENTNEKDMDQNIDVEINDKNEEQNEDIKNNQNELENKIVLLQNRLEDIEDKYKRNLAEFENFKKRTDKEKLKTYDRAKVDLVEKLLPVLDSINSAMKISEDKEYLEGLDQVNKQLLVFLKQNNVEEIKTIGEHFDPKLHEAISVVESDKEEGIIIEEFRKGYKLGDDVIRHSMVIVSK